MMNKRKSNKELEVDFIGGEELTKQEEAELGKFFKKKKEKNLSANKKEKGTCKLNLPSANN